MNAPMSKEFLKLLELLSKIRDQEKKGEILQKLLDTRNSNSNIQGQDIIIENLGSILESNK